MVNDLREPFSRRIVRHQRQIIVRFEQLDGTHARVRRVPELIETADPRAW